MQKSWEAFTKSEARQDCHLLVAYIAGVANTPERIIELLIQDVRPRGDFALKIVAGSEGGTVFLALAAALDAQDIANALNAHESDLGLGFASEYHCFVDEAKAQAILDAALVEIGGER